MSSDVLEKRYRMLLRAYPAGYRRERADELVDTLIGDEPTDRRWPSLREAASLIRGALRVHGGSTAPRPTAVLLWQGIHLGAMAVLALGVLIGLDDLVEAFQFGGFSDPLTVLRNQGVHEVMVIAALVALVAGRTRTAAVLAVAAAVVPTVISPYLFLNGLPQWWAPVVAAPLILVGLWRPADVPPTPRANAVLVTAGILALHLIPAGGFRRVDMSSQVVAATMVIVGIVGFLWVATADQRLLIAVAPTLLLGTLHQLGNDMSTGSCCAGRTLCRPSPSRS
ncbi:hypothetical protein GCM10029963_23760 [Micromonospora andamanensis]